MKNNTSNLLFGLLILGTFAACTKSKEILHNQNDQAPPPSSFVEYVIPKGEHYSQQNGFVATEYSELKFSVKFDSSAIYTSVSGENQYDINKLFGFADNEGSHMEYSARIGWRWSEGALRLFGYTHNEGQMAFEELAAISIGEVHKCTIKISGDTYVFSVDGQSVSMSRESKTSTAKGYKLFPYFGGNETAPHEIHIWINEE